MRAVILAGGKGTRLKPYTTTIPKPLVPLGNEFPVMEIVVRQLALNGFTRITVCLNHMANLVQAFFGDGSRWNIRIDYSLEDKPLSTIGPLTLIEDLPENFLVMNGDILSDINFSSLFEYHVKDRNDVTVSTYQRQSKIDFGVLEYDEKYKIIGFREKPVYDFSVSMGIYCINRNIIDRLRKNEYYGFDHLMLDGIKNGNKILTYPFNGFWLDIGRPEDYDYANDHFDEIMSKIGLSR
jgi:NDP-mannose synthase